jgi:tetratricopeptide (TPR) repeat protein
VADEEKGSDLALEKEGPGIGFQIEMWITDTLVRYWRVMAGTIVAVLVAALLYGQYLSWYQSSQRRSTGSIADVQGELDQSLEDLVRIKAGEVPDKHIDSAKVTEAANRLVEVARSASGTASVEASLKAAELFRIAGDNAGRRSALEVAAPHAQGVLKYAVEAGLATLDVEQGSADAAITRYRELQRLDDALARMATLDLATALEALDRKAEAVAAYDEFLQKWPDAPEKADVESRRARSAGQGG